MQLMEPEGELGIKEAKLVGAINNGHMGGNHDQQDIPVASPSINDRHQARPARGASALNGAVHPHADKRARAKDAESTERDKREPREAPDSTTPEDHANLGKEGRQQEATGKTAAGVETPISASTISTAFSVDEFRELAEQMEAAAEMEQKMSIDDSHNSAHGGDRTTDPQEGDKKKRKRRTPSTAPDESPAALSVKRKPGRPRKDSVSEQQRQFDQSVVSPSATWPAVVMGDPMKELQRACQYGQTGSVEAMLKKGGVRVSDTDANQNTALHEAAVYGKAEVVKLLIKHGSPLEPVNVLNDTPLMLSRSVLVTQLLKEFVARMAAARPKLHSAVLSNDLEAVRAVLQEHGSEVNETDELGFTALHWCAVKNRPDMIKCIVSLVAPKHVDLNCQSTELQLTPLHEAARFNSADAVQCLLDLQADPLLSDAQGFLALDHSPNKLIRRLFRRFGRKHNIAELLRSPQLPLAEEGDEPEALALDDHHDHPSSSVGFTREERKLQQVLSILGRSEGSPPKPLSVRVKKRGRPPKPSTASTAGRSSSQLDKSTGRTLLHRYADKGNVTMLKELVVAEPGLVNATDHAGFTPLHEAALKGHVEAVKALLAANAQLNVQASSNGDTPLHDAVENGHVEVVRLLLEAKADASLANAAGARAIDVADHPDIIALLRKAGAVDAGAVDEPAPTQHLERKKGRKTSSSPPAPVKRKPGRPRKQNTAEADPSPDTSLPLVLVNLDTAEWHFLSCQLEDRSASFRPKFREDYGRELNADDRDRLLAVPKIAAISPLQEALKNDHRSIYLLDKAAVLTAFSKLVKEAQCEHIDLGGRPKEPAVPVPPAATATATTTTTDNLPLKFKMKQQWKPK